MVKIDPPKLFPPGTDFGPPGTFFTENLDPLSQKRVPPGTYLIEVWTPRPLWNMDPFMSADTHWFSFTDQLAHGLVSYPGFWWGVPTQQEPGYETSPWWNKFFRLGPMRNTYPLSFLHNVSILHITHVSLCTRHLIPTFHAASSVWGQLTVARCCRCM